MAWALLPLTTVLRPAAGQETPNPSDIQAIVRASERVTAADRRASAGFDFHETDLEGDGSKRTYAVHMLFGSPYRELVAINGHALSNEQQQREQRKLKEEVSRRKAESPQERARRIARYQQQQKRDTRFIEEFVRAFDFKLSGEEQMDGRHVYVVHATPLPGFRPTDRITEVLRGMRGTLWIDQGTHQWVKVQAQVTHPVSIEGFLAKVEPGTRFELEKMPVVGNIWMPKHFSMTSNARIFSLIHYGSHQDAWYFDYHQADADEATPK